MKSPRSKIWLFLNLFLCGCVSINVPIPKSSPSTRAALIYKNPDSPYKEIPPIQFDKVWRSDRTKNSISLKSECKDDGSLRLESYQTDFFNALDEPKILDQSGNDKSVTVDLEGNVDDHFVKVRIRSFLKNKCLINVTYIARPKTFAGEIQIFEKFSESVDGQ